MKIITNEIITKFKNYLTEEEKAKATIEKYIRDILAFMKWMCGREVEKTAVLEYKKKLIENYAPTSVNSMLSSLNIFFAFNEWFSCRVPNLEDSKSNFCKPG